MTLTQRQGPAVQRRAGLLGWDAMQNWLLASLAVLVACGQDLPGRGSTACHDWQDAVCDYNQKCQGTLNRAQCNDQFQAITCKSDGLAHTCEDAYRNLACKVEPPSTCSAAEVADPKPAQDACSTLIDRFCDRYVTCGTADSKDSCVMIASTQAFDCSRAIGYTLDFESCLAAIAAADCSSLEDPDKPPDPCLDVIELSR
jgi:hypothetical protein